jgi:pilus assembly protein CpaD
MATTSSPIIWRCLLAALACAMVAACQSQYPESKIQLDQADYRAKYPIRVESNLIQANFVGTDAGKLSLDELVQLDQMVDDYVAHGQKPLLIVMPGNGLQYRNLASEIERRALHHSLAKSEVLVGVDPEAAMNDEVTVSYLVHTATSPECGNWDEEPGNNELNTNSENFGCATQHNLALMVANPGDLVEPETFSTRDAQRTVAIIDAYRSGKNPQVEWPQATGGTQLDFGTAGSSD